jgi:hypothetical protein
LALTRAQILQGNSANGIILPGTPQGVTAGSGVTIAPSGALSVNTLDPAFNAFIRTNSLTAYNAYVWPNLVGAAGTQLTSDGAGNLFWSDSDGIPWTAKGQLIVGTGVGTDVLLNVGTDTSVLMADATTASGLTYSNLSTAAIQIPAGTTLQQPASSSIGQIRYNTDNDEFEGYSGAPALWQSIGGMPTGGGSDKIFYLNSQIVTTNYSIPSAPILKNGMSAGPITINAGITVTVPAGQSWSIV